MHLLRLRPVDANTGSTYCVTMLRKLRQIRRFVPSATLQMLVIALVNWCTSWPYGSLDESTAVGSECGNPSENLRPHN